MRNKLSCRLCTRYNHILCYAWFCAIFRVIVFGLSCYSRTYSGCFIYGSASRLPPEQIDDRSSRWETWGGTVHALNLTAWYLPLLSAFEGPQVYVVSKVAALFLFLTLCLCIMDCILFTWLLLSELAFDSRMNYLTRRATPVLPS